MPRSAELAAPAKVNVHLGVHTQLDERGYHRVDSVTMAVGLFDRVRVSEVAGPAADGGPHVCMSTDVGVVPRRNTVWKAAMALCDALGERPAWRIEVQKNVPHQSGLGAASSDAASTILALCSLWGADPADERVVAAARSVGADVPFFLNPVPSYLAGAGDVLKRSFPQMNDVPVVLARPAGGVSTVEAYRAFDLDPARAEDPAGMFDALERGDASLVAGRLHNNLEPVALRLVPECVAVKEWLLGREGVCGAQVSGSGSCVFAFCESEEAARLLAQEARCKHGWWAASCVTVGAGSQFC